jgi:hypothetical protein
LTLFAGLPTLLYVRPGTIYGVWSTVAGGISTLATQNSTGAGTYLVNQSPNNLFDYDLTTRYSSRGYSTSGSNSYAGLNTGFFVTMSQCQPVLTEFRFGNAYTNSAGEPLTITIEGTNCNNMFTCTNWASVYSGSTGLAIQVNSLAYGSYQSVTNINAYLSYRFLVTTKRNTSAYVGYSEVELYGSTSSAGLTKTPSSKFNCF